MKRASISETKNNLSAYLDLVKQGETILIVDRDRPVAKLEPIYQEKSAEGRLSRLERAGIIRRGAGKRLKEIIETPPPAAEASVLEALLEERQEER